MSTNILQYVNVLLLFLIVGIHSGAMARGRGGGRERGTPHMKGVGMLVGNFELNP